MPMTPMAEFLAAISPQLSALLRACADYLDGGESEADFVEDELPMFHLNDRGEVVSG